MYEYKGKVVRVIDGDTIKVDIDLGFNSHTIALIRLARIDAAEIKLYKGVTEEEKQLGLAAKEWLINNISDITLKTERDSTGKFGRYISEIYANSENINDKLVTMGFAKYKEY